ncbi:hypothetical protein [Sulfobacillus harzensis]|uniref:Uncharacterized protein n=1 Tax=Sulfobacillus harzensis TaxID=2729629 RepID=A0A7Y0Q4J1_9FIRM|nr:hypothetical protein [Sulfobacillus harzensis]NMP24470.1 hypothetical protein [Sulfobacillus harzensis]
MDDVVYVNWDPYDATRRYCRCPNCGYSWPHMETGNLARDKRWAGEHYGVPTQCGNCGLWSKPTTTKRQWRRGQQRQLCPEPPRDLRQVVLEEEEER